MSKHPPALRESDIEKYLVFRVRAAGGEVRKVRWVGRRGAPDRVVMLDGTFWVELKRPGEHPRPEQAREHRRMIRQGADVSTLSTFLEVDEFMRRIFPCN